MKIGESLHDIKLDDHTIFLMSMFENPIASDISILTTLDKGKIYLSLVDISLNENWK